MKGHRKRKKAKKISALNKALIIIGIVSTGFLTYIFYRIGNSDRQLFSIILVPLILGIIAESIRLGIKCRDLGLKILSSLVLSLFAFLPGQRERRYLFENHIESWPYIFIFIFLVFSIAYHEKKLTIRLTEGITLLQSIALIYWSIDIGLFNKHSIFFQVLLILGLLFVVISFIHAFSYISLSKKARLFLSIWSSIIMLIFGIDYVYRTLQLDIDTTNENLYILAYFLLGISLVYILNNIFMLSEYLPGNSRFYGNTHLKEIRANNKKHIERYSSKQVKIIDSILALLIVSSIFYFNHRFKILPRHTMIWLLFWLLPLFIFLKNLLGSNLKRDDSIGQ